MTYQRNETPEPLASEPIGVSIDNDCPSQIVADLLNQIADLKAALQLLHINRGGCPKPNGTWWRDADCPACVALMKAEAKPLPGANQGAQA